MASAVITTPSKGTSSNMGRNAVISLDFSSTGRCAAKRNESGDTAATRWTGRPPAPREPFTVFPSTAKRRNRTGS